MIKSWELMQLDLIHLHNNILRFTPWSYVIIHRHARILSGRGCRSIGGPHPNANPLRKILIYFNSESVPESRPWTSLPPIKQNYNITDLGSVVRSMDSEISYVFINQVLINCNSWNAAMLLLKEDYRQIFDKFPF